MMSRKSLMIFLVPFVLVAQSKVTLGQESPLGFVKSFYDWYVPLANRNHNETACDITIRTKCSLFSQDLANALREDFVAQAKAHGEIVGIDWDPFLSTQDPEEHYEVGKVAQKGDRWFVDIHGIRDGKKRTSPDVIAELQKVGSGWVFINFHTPGGADLLSSLKRLRESRHK